MDWKELKEKLKRLQSEGKTEEEAAEILKDEIGAFAKECFEHPEKMVDTIPDLGGAIQNNPILSILLFVLLFRPIGGWSGK